VDANAELAALFSTAAIACSDDIVINMDTDRYIDLRWTILPPTGTHSRFYYHPMYLRGAYERLVELPRKAK
jgi:hypothetical protein